VDEQFFINLKRGIKLLSGNEQIPVVIGGDWNCTLSWDPPEVNIDVLNMRDLPNRRHSELLNEICVELKLSDPFRNLYYNKRDFTYAPRSVTLQNKSRIDFFLVTDSSCGQVTDCVISDTLQNKLSIIKR
jgi:exonuclease III